MQHMFCRLLAVLLIISTGIIFGIRAVDAQYTAPVRKADALPQLTSEEKAEIASQVMLDTVIFNELFNASNDTHDWIELRNITNTDVDLSVWRLIVATSERSLSIKFPAGTVLPAGELLLFVNTDPSEPNMPLTTSEDPSYRYLVDETFTLPQADFLLMLRSPTKWEDSAGSYLFGYETIVPTIDFTVDTAWSRAKASVFGHRTEAWVISGYKSGLGYDADASKDISLGTPGHYRDMFGDINGDGTINILDMVFVASQMGQSGETTADVNSDGIVNIQDLVVVANGISGVAAAPSAHALTAGQVQEWLQLARGK